MGYEQELIRDGKCAELVWIPTEDGMIDGRCMEPITDQVFMFKAYSEPVARPTQLPMCLGHAEAAVGYSAMTELERIEWEKREDVL